MSLIETFRSRVVGDIMEMPTMDQSWDHFRTFFKGKFQSSPPSGDDIFRLGDELSSAFRSNRLPSRRKSGTSTDTAQSEASAGGAVWEALVVWYLNICLAGSHSVAIKKRSQLPRLVRDALKITISGSASASLTEPDVVVLTVDDPHLDDLLPATPKKGSNPFTALDKLIDDSVRSDPSYKKRIKVINIQCKTNWNDSIQTPMLWNLLYAAARSPSSSTMLPVLGSDSITFGDNGNYIKELADFKYAFVTVPTNKLEAFTATSSPVIRSRSFTGGSYWGRPNSDFICTSVKEFFNKNTLSLSLGIRPGCGFAETAPNVDKSIFKIT